MKYTYTPKGVCSRQISFDLEDGVVKNLAFVGGCNGNLKGISALVEGQKAADVLGKLRGLKCGMKNTSCPDQLACALEAALAETKD